MKTVNRLTNRELEILNLLSKGYTSREMGLKLFLSEETIKSHRKNLINKMDAKNSANLVRIAFENQVIIPEKLMNNYTYNLNNLHELVA